MQIIRFLTTSLLFLFVLVTASLITLAADPGTGIGRNVDDSRRYTAADQRPGSVLFYNFYISGAADSSTTDTDSFNQPRR